MWSGIVDVLNNTIFRFAEFHCTIVLHMIVSFLCTVTGGQQKSLHENRNKTINEKFEE